MAIAYCAENPVDLVIMDVMMKYGLDGLTCAKTIKNNNPEIKIIMTTSAAESRWIDKARAAGIESFSSGVQKAIIWLEGNGIARGYNDGTFKPNGGCQRQHMAIFLYRYDKNIK